MLVDLKGAYETESWHSPAHPRVIGFVFLPDPGREQLSFVPASQILPMSFNQYRDFLSKHTIVEHGEQAEMVKRVGTRIERDVER